MTGQTGTTAYDAVVYPTALFAQTAPDRMATIATLAGLDPPPIATARVLEIAAGDGFNLTALAAAWPDAAFLGFDLAASAVARGNETIAAAGLSNIRLEVIDLLEAGDMLDGTFDYIIAHGLYAWVPPEVRAATMALIGRRLSPNGVAFVSYNALPGGYHRMALRDALLFAVADIEDDQARLDVAYENLELLARGTAQESPAQASLRHAAEAALNQPRSVVFHDELGAHYHPQSLSDVVDAARGAGLRFLGEATLGCLQQAFLPEGWPMSSDPDLQLLHLRQAEDYRQVRFFRSTLFVRDALRPARWLDTRTMDRLYAACDCTRIDTTTFRNVRGEFEIDDADLAAILARLIDAAPARIPVADLGAGEMQRTALFELFDAGHVQLHTVAAPHAVAAGERPRASALARVMAAAEASMIPTLGHELLPADAAGRALLPLLDGTRDRAALAQTTDPATLETVLGELARTGLLLE